MVGIEQEKLPEYVDFLNPIEINYGEKVKFIYKRLKYYSQIYKIK